MRKIVCAAAFSALALALAGCQEPQTPAVAAYQNSDTATSGVCGVLGSCPASTAPYPMQGISSGGSTD